jgi:hypothetical protein
MAQEIIDTGELPNDGSGDPLRLAFDKINNNFANLFTLTGANNQIVELVDPYGPNTDPYITNSSGNTNTINISNIYINNTFDSSTGLSIVPKKTLSIPPPLELTTGPYGYQEYINIGATANDGNGDPLRVAFGKINNNFSNLFLTTNVTLTEYTIGTTTNQVIFEVPVQQFYQAQFQIRSSAPGPDMQDITLNASITNNLAGVRFTGHSTLFEGNVVCRYDMDVIGGNVRVLINPLQNEVIEHFISALVTYKNTIVPAGIELSLNNYPPGYLLGTENGIILTTEQSE